MRILVAGLIVTAGTAFAFAQEPTRITSVSNVRLRATPSEHADVVAHLPLGTDLVQLETGGDGASWTRVRLPGGQDGWVPTRLTRSLSRSRRHEVLESIIEERLPRKGDGFAARAELSALAESALKSAPDSETGGRFALHWVRATSSALQAVPRGGGRQAPYKEWLEPRAGVVVYNEPGGNWMIRPAHLWKVHDEYARSASADELAWAAVLNGLPGECEGFVPCYLNRMNRLEGEYLRRSALGGHVNEAVARVANASTWDLVGVKPKFFDPSKDCHELLQALEPLRAALITTRAEHLQAALAQLDKLRSTCRALNNAP